MLAYSLHQQLLHTSAPTLSPFLYVVRRYVCFVCKYTYASYLSVYVSIFICMHVCMYACMYVCMYVCICIYVCNIHTHIYVYMCVCVYVCVYIFHIQQVCFKSSTGLTKPQRALTQLRLRERSLQ